MLVSGEDDALEIATRLSAPFQLLVLRITAVVQEEGAGIGSHQEQVL